MASFRPFHEEVETVTAGFFDGRRVAVMYHSVSNPAVAPHEEEHEMLMRGTADGMIVSLLAFVAAKGNISERDRRICRTTFSELVDETRHAHEVAATYLGLNRFEPARIATLYDDLPPEYQSYYSVLGDLFDPLLENGFLRYRLAHILLYNVVFASRCWERLQGFWYSEPLCLRPMENPNVRLNHAIAALSNGRLDEIISVASSAAEKALTDRGLPLWDIRDSSQWPARPESADLAERSIFDAVRPALVNACDLPVLSTEERQNITRREIATLRDIGIELKPTSQIGDGRSVIADALGTQNDVRLLTTMSALSGVIRTGVDPTQLRISNTDGMECLWEEPAASVALCQCNPGDVGWWYVMAQLESTGEAVVLWRISATEVLALLTTLAERHAIENDPSLDALVFDMPRPDQAPFVWEATSLVNEICDAKPRPEYRCRVWSYVRDNWYHFFEENIRMAANEGRTVRIGVLFSQSTNEQREKKSILRADATGLACIAMKVTESEVMFLRWVTSFAGVQVRQLAEALAAANEAVELMDFPELAESRLSVGAALKAAVTLWPEL